MDNSVHSMGFDKLTFPYRVLVYYTMRRQMKPNPWTESDSSQARFMAGGLISMLMLANVLAVIFLYFDISGAPFHAINETAGLSIIVFSLTFGFNYLVIGRLGPYEDMRKAFDQLPDNIRRKHVRWIEIYVALSGILFVFALSLPHHIV